VARKLILGLGCYVVRIGDCGDYQSDGLRGSPARAGGSTSKRPSYLLYFGG